MLITQASAVTSYMRNHVRGVMVLEDSWLGQRVAEFSILAVIEVQ